MSGDCGNDMTCPSAPDWRKDSASFDTVADLYDACRPGYPQELIESVISLTGIPAGGKILEIGSGTGKATLLFAKRGYEILCIEPGKNLAALAARNLKDYRGVTFEITRFEDWQEKAAGFELVVSAQAFHWVPKEIGYKKAAHALKSEGYLALFWNMYPGFQGQLRDELDEIYRGVFPSLSTPLNANKETIQNRINEIGESGCFGRVIVRRFRWSMRYNTEQYIGLLNTHSDHLRLPDETRCLLFKNIAALIDRHGGSIQRPYLSVLYVARKM